MDGEASQAAPGGGSGDAAGVPGERRRYWAGVAWLVLLGALGVAGLLSLAAWHRRAVHALAAGAVAERGDWAVRQVAREVARAIDGGDWESLSLSLRAMNAAEPSLAFLEVRSGDVTLFLEDDASWNVPAPAGRPDPLGLPVRLDRAALATGGGPEEPVVTFTLDLPDAGGTDVQVELGLDQGAIGREEWSARRAVDSIYRACAAGWLAVLSLAVCGLTWVWRRQLAVERQRRRGEHLAFSGVLANGIVHDFRNPMSSMRLDAQLLAQEAARGPDCRLPKVREWAGRIQATLDRLENIFRDFLTLARPDAAPLPAAAVNPLDAARDAAAMLAARFDAAHVAVEFEAPPGGTPPAAAAPTALKRALLNILANAAQHAKSRAWVSAAAGRDGVELAVEDDGPGVPRKDRERIFEMFYTTRPQGTGLGLYLARLALERTGGSLELVPGRRGGGARFRILLPPATGKEPPCES